MASKSNVAFSKNDLSLFLPTEAGDVDSLRHTVDKSELKFEKGKEKEIALKGKFDATKKIQRWRAGANDEDDDDSESESESDSAVKALSTQKNPTPATALVLAPAPAYKKTSAPSPPSTDDDAPRQPRQRIVAAVVTSSSTAPPADDSSSDSDSDSNDEIAKRRQRIKAKVLASQKTEEAPQLPPQLQQQPTTTESKTESMNELNAPDSSSSSSSSSSSDSDSDAPAPQISKPIYIPRSKRITLSSSEVLSNQQAEIALKLSNDLKARALETQLAVFESSRLEKLEKNKMEDLELAGMPDDSDECTVEEQNARKVEWEMREIMRIVRDKMERAKIVGEGEGDGEKQRFGKMTDEQRMAEDEDFRDEVEQRQKSEKEARNSWNNNNTDGNSNNKKVGKVLHKGAFYMDAASMKNDDDVRLKNYHLQATSEDLFKKTRDAMPDVMKTQKFGFTGQSRYKGLKGEDTTQKNAIGVVGDVGGWKKGEGSNSKKNNTNTNNSNKNNKKRNYEGVREGEEEKKAKQG